MLPEVRRCRTFQGQQMALRCGRGRNRTEKQGRGRKQGRAAPLTWLAWSRGPCSRSRQQLRLRKSEPLCPNPMAKAWDNTPWNNSVPCESHSTSWLPSGVLRPGGLRAGGHSQDLPRELWPVEGRRGPAENTWGFWCGRHLLVSQVMRSHSLKLHGLRAH